VAGEDFPVGVMAADLLVQLVIALAQPGQLSLHLLFPALGLVEFIFVHQATAGRQQ